MSPRHATTVEPKGLVGPSAARRAGEATAAVVDVPHSPSGALQANPGLALAEPAIATFDLRCCDRFAVDWAPPTG